MPKFKEICAGLALWNRDKSQEVGGKSDGIEGWASCFKTATPIDRIFAMEAFKDWFKKNQKRLRLRKNKKTFKLKAVMLWGLSIMDGQSNTKANRMYLLKRFEEFRETNDKDVLKFVVRKPVKRKRERVVVPKKTSTNKVSKQVARGLPVKRKRKVASKSVVAKKERKVAQRPVSVVHPRKRKGPMLAKENVVTETVKKKRAKKSPPPIVFKNNVKDCLYCSPYSMANALHYLKEKVEDKEKKAALKDLVDILKDNADVFSTPSIYHNKILTEELAKEHPILQQLAIKKSIGGKICFTKGNKNERGITHFLHTSKNIYTQKLKPSHEKGSYLDTLKKLGELQVCIFRLNSSDGREIKHTVCVVDNWIFDANMENALLLTQENMDKCCRGVDYTDTVKFGYGTYSYICDFSGF